MKTTDRISKNNKEQKNTKTYIMLDYKKCNAIYIRRARRAIKKKTRTLKMK